MILDLREEPYDGPAATSLVAAVQAEYEQRYGSHDETPVATGGLRRHGHETVEIKRMFVTVGWRGRGFARQVLAHLESLAREFGARRVVLETGVKQPEAIALYETSGYRRIDGFGHYAGHELSVSFGKDL